MKLSRPESQNQSRTKPADFRRDIIICVLSKRKGEVKKFQSRTSYKHEGRMYTGWQTNEAPVKCLLHKAANNGHPIRQIFYLCSPECREKTIREIDGSMLSTEERWRSEISRYMCSEGYRIVSETIAEFKPIRYQTDNPSGCLKDVMDQLQPGTVVHIDTTGGGRDVIPIITLAIDVALAQEHRVPPTGITLENIKLGDIVFSNNISNPKTIVSQNESYGLVNLVNAVDAFTRYGKADQLEEYFKESHDSNIKKLCKLMKAFSEDLSLCRTHGILETVDKIQQQLELMDNATNADQNMTMGELLLRNMVPRIKADFINTKLTDSEREDLGNQTPVPAWTAQTAEVIRWCLDRQMIQQALALHHELTAQCLMNLGDIVHPGTDTLDRLKNRFSSYCNGAAANRNYGEDSDNAEDCETVDKRKFDELLIEVSLENPDIDISHLREFLCIRYLNEISTPLFNVRNEPDRLRAAIIWFRYLWHTRNIILHAGEAATENKKLQRFARLYSGLYGTMRYAQDGTFESLKTDILTALEYATRRNAPTNSPEESKWDDTLKKIAQERTPLANLAEKSATCEDERVAETINKIVELLNHTNSEQGLSPYDLMRSVSEDLLLCNKAVKELVKEQDRSYEAVIYLSVDDKFLDYAKGLGQLRQLVLNHIEPKSNMAPWLKIVHNKKYVSAKKHIKAAKPSDFICSKTPGLQKALGIKKRGRAYGRAKN